jgi:hypothetical protein
MTSDIGRKRSRLIQIICQGWITAQEYPGTLDSEIVYDRLLSEGEHFAEGEMDALLTHLRDKEQIIHDPVLHFRPREEGEARRHDYQRDRGLVMLEPWESAGPRYRSRITNFLDGPEQEDKQGL